MSAACPGGVYYRGQVAQVFDQQLDIEASEDQQEQYDPWEAVEVVWDGGKSSSGYGGVHPFPLNMLGCSQLGSCWHVMAMHCLCA